jgi:hypothetical protein
MDAGLQIDFSEYTARTVSFLARNFYNLKYVALVLAFCINFILLFYKVCTFYIFVLLRGTIYFTVGYLFEFGYSGIDITCFFPCMNITSLL